MIKNLVIPATVSTKVLAHKLPTRAIDLHPLTLVKLVQSGHIEYHYQTKDRDGYFDPEDMARIDALLSKPSK